MQAGILLTGICIRVHRTCQNPPLVPRLPKSFLVNGQKGTTNKCANQENPVFYIFVLLVALFIHTPLTEYISILISEKAGLYEHLVHRPFSNLSGAHSRPVAVVA